MQLFTTRFTYFSGKIFVIHRSNSLFLQNTDFKSVVSIVPCSAKTGEGIPDLLMLLVQLTQKMMSKQLLLLSDLKCTILEVKVVFYYRGCFM